MGASLGIHLREPQFFTYYGNEQQREASEALDDAIASHLQEIGAGTTIPIRNEVPKELDVPVGLMNPPFSTVNEKEFEINFSTNLEGKLKITYEGYESDEKKIANQKDQKILFERPKTEKFCLNFTFDVESGVSARFYTFVIHGNGEPVVVEDSLIVDGKKVIVEKIFGQDGDLTNEDEGNTCLICYSEKATVVALPCRHCCMCRACSERFANMSINCPLCRAHITELVELKAKEEVAKT